MTAPAVSRQLRRLGFHPVGTATRNREGLRVTGSALGRVRVTADLDSPRAARDLAIAARTALETAGYQVEPSGDAAFYVTKATV